MLRRFTFAKVTLPSFDRSFSARARAGWGICIALDAVLEHCLTA